MPELSPDEIIGGVVVLAAIGGVALILVAAVAFSVGVEKVLELRARRRSSRKVRT
jgi:hypothetical protein